MPATVEICETNGSGVGSVTHNVSNSDMGNYDMPNMDPTARAIIPGQRSVAKYQRVHVTAMNTSSQIDDIRVWQTGGMIGAASHVSNLKTSGYGGAQAYVQGVNTAITGVDQVVPQALPNSANLGISGSLTGALLAIGYSDYLIHQIITNAADPSGSTFNINVQYGEVL